MLRFLKPDIRKIALGLLLFAASSFFWRTYTISRISDTFPHGFPFQFYMGWGPCRPGEICHEFHSLYLVLDLAIWYIISALIVDRVRKP
jgi:hypothetical protein